MKTLSVKQPWAYLLCSGIKDIENRTWKLPEKYKGEMVLIHASANPKSWEQFTNYIEKLDSENLELQRIIRDNGYSKSWLNSLETSGILGSVRFTDCVINADSIWAEKSMSYPCDREDEYRDENGNLNYETYRKDIIGYFDQKPIYNWKAEDAILFDKPILNVKGKLRFWDYDLPEEYEKLLKL